MNIQERTISDIVNVELREFSMYTIENRAIPSVIDGFKATQRKLVYAMVNEHKGNKVKVAELGGGLAKLNYHHGEGSAQGAAVGLGQDWNNNVPVFTGHGNFGSRLVPEAAAPRYIYASLSPAFRKYFIDTEVAPTAFDPENPEPAFYLPIVPWVLLNGVSGMAVGFKTEILPRSIESITSAVKECLKSPKKFVEADKPIAPSYPSFKGEVTQVSSNQWKTSGIIKFNGKNTYTISELPIGFDREAYIEFLNGLLDKDMIRDYDDSCSKAGFGFDVKVTPQQKVMIDKDVMKYFKLERTHTEILTTLGYDGKLKIFDSVAKLIAYFVEYRISKFADKIAYDIKENETDVNELIHRKKFIDMVINNKIDFRKSTKQQLLDFVCTQVSPEDFAKRFINIPLYECTQDEVLKIESKINAKNAILETLRKTTPENLYKTHLNSL